MTTKCWILMDFDTFLYSLLMFTGRCLGKRTSTWLLNGFFNDIWYGKQKHILGASVGGFVKWLSFSVAVTFMTPPRSPPILLASSPSDMFQFGRFDFSVQLLKSIVVEQFCLVWLKNHNLGDYHPFTSYLMFTHVGLWPITRFRLVNQNMKHHEAKTTIRIYPYLSTFKLTPTIWNLDQHQLR